MVAVAIALSAASILLSVLHSPILKSTCSKWGGHKYMSKLKDLKKTVTTVESVLRDAAACEVLTDEAQDFIEKLKTAVYDADDLFDEFRTLAERKHNKLKERNHLFKKVRRFLCSDMSLNIARKMSGKIKKIKKNLDDIASDHTKFSFAVDSKLIRNRREETCSYVKAPTVIGRESDVEVIVDKLLDLNGQKGARFLNVVGIGGMGKTALAQLVCADQRVENEFSSKLWWVCVADQDKNQFDKKAILCKILDLATGYKHHDLSLEQVQKKLRLELAGKKYLLVLDDLWNEDRAKWMDVEDYLMLGAAESRIMVTTRSLDVANVVGDGHHIHELKGLSDYNSWRLFEMTAFKETPKEHANPLKLEVGKKIVEQCSNVPLAIKVVGSLLWDQDLDKWRSFERSGLGGIRNHKGDNEIMAILKLSYRNLEPSLKSCFTYCALFPKDYVIEKVILIRLWMAHGYIVPFDRAQSLEEASEEHFMILLRRCFFQNVKMDEHGNVRSFKLHDLIHDVAQEVAGGEMLVAISETSKLSAKVRHVFNDSRVREENFYSNVKVRSYMQFYNRFQAEDDLQFQRNRLFRNGGCLRTLTLVNVGMKTLPDSIGKLLHLRYLDLSWNSELATLPDSITKLHNLQTLKLEGCERLRELPKKFSRLVSLLHLNIEWCYVMEYMPVDMDKLTSLCELTDFVVADECSSGDSRVGRLKDLKSLVVNLKGRIHIKIQDNFKRADVYDWEGSCFEVAEHLQAVHIDFPYVDDGIAAKDEVLCEKLLPPRNVTELKLKWYKGVKFLRWGGTDYNWATILPNLVSIEIDHCSRLKCLPMLSKLKYLKSLRLYSLDQLEYIDDTSYSSSCGPSKGGESKEESECTLYPSLESLDIWGVPKLKGIFAGLEFSDSSSSSNNAELWQRSFPRLSRLMMNYHGLWQRSFRRLTKLEIPKNTSGSREDSLVVHLGRVEYLKSLPAGRPIKIKLRDVEVESLAEVGELLKYCTSLRTLTLKSCSKLTHLSWGRWEQLTTIESLRIHNCGKLKWEEGDKEDGMPWRQLNHNLRSLELRDIESLKVLPRGMQCLFALENLTIQRCKNLKALPEWISCLSSLQSLTLKDCDKLESIPKGVQNMTSLKELQIYGRCSHILKSRCQQPYGEDSPIIRHIPNVYIQK